MMMYGEDVPPRKVERIETLHAQEVMLRSAIIEEFRATFNLACIFADALFAVAPDHRLIHIARFEGMLGRFELKEKDEISIEVVAPVVQTVPESGVLPLSERPVGGIEDSGAGTVSDSATLSVGDMLAQGGGSPSEQADGDGSSASSSPRSGELSDDGGRGEELAPSSVPSVGESV